MFLYYRELSLSDLAPLITVVIGEFHSIEGKPSILHCHLCSGGIWLEVITVLFKCFLCIFCNPYRKRSSKFISLTPLFYTLLLCRLSTTEWYLHVRFKLLFPASTTVLLCYIFLTCCISDTKSVFCRSLSSMQCYQGFHLPISVLQI